MVLSYQKLKDEFPNWAEDDFRLGMYGRCANIVESILFAMIFEKDQLVDQNWYKKVTLYCTTRPKNNFGYTQ